MSSRAGLGIKVAGIKVAEPSNAPTLLTFRGNLLNVLSLGWMGDLGEIDETLAMADFLIR